MVVAVYVNASPGERCPFACARDARAKASSSLCCKRCLGKMDWPRGTADEPDQAETMDTTTRRWVRGYSRVRWKEEPPALRFLDKKSATLSREEHFLSQ